MDGGVQLPVPLPVGLDDDGVDGHQQQQRPRLLAPSGAPFSSSRSIAIIAILAVIAILAILAIIASAPFSWQVALTHFAVYIVKHVIV